MSPTDPVQDVIAAAARKVADEARQARPIRDRPTFEYRHGHDLDLPDLHPYAVGDDEPDWSGHVIEYFYEDPEPCEHQWQAGVINVTIPGQGTASTGPVRFCEKCRSIEPVKPTNPTEEPA